MQSVVNFFQRVFHLFYESGVYKANPCDVGVWKFLQPIGFGLQKLSVSCQCCSGARILFVAILGLFLPHYWMHGLVALMLSVVLVSAIIYVATHEEETPPPDQTELETYGRAGSLEQAISVLEGDSKYVTSSLSALPPDHTAREALIMRKVQLDNAISILRGEESERCTRRDCLSTVPGELP